MARTRKERFVARDDGQGVDLSPLSGACLTEEGAKIVTVQFLAESLNRFSHQVGRLAEVLDKARLA